MDDLATPTDADAPMDTPDREPRYNLQAEQSAIGGMLLSRDVIDDVMEEVVPADFYFPKHEIIALAIGRLVARNEPTDVISVVAELERAGELRQAGDASYLHELTGLVPTAANAGYYAGLVKEAAVKRRLVEGGTRIVQMGYSSEGQLDDLVERARQEVDRVTSVHHRQIRKIGDTFIELVEAMETKPNYTPTPWESIDKMIGGFAPGSLYVFGARPGDGKSISVLECAAKLAHTGMVAFSSLEMTEQELQLRLISQYGQIHMTSLRNHTLTDMDWRHFAEARSAVQDAPIFVDDTPAATIATIRAHARAVARRGPLAGIVVDYVQLVEGDGQDRRMVVDNVSRALKQLAKDMHVPLIVAAQLRRLAPQRGTVPLPSLQDLRESGGIENNADAVLLLHRDREKKPHDVKVIIPKNRHGDVGTVTLAWEAQYARLKDKLWSPTALIEREEV